MSLFIPFSTLSDETSPPGSDCSVDIDECSSFPCLHGGICSQGEPSTFTCSCPSGVTGVLCEVVATATFNGVSALTFTLPPTQDVSSSSQAPPTSETLTRRRRWAWRDSYVYDGTHRDTSGNQRTRYLSRNKRQAIVIPSEGAGAVVLSQVQFTMTTTVLNGILLVLTGVGIPKNGLIGWLVF